MKQQEPKDTRGLRREAEFIARRVSVFFRVDHPARPEEMDHLPPPPSMSNREMAEGCRRNVDEARGMLERAKERLRDPMSHAHRLMDEAREELHPLLTLAVKAQFQDDVTRAADEILHWQKRAAELERLPPNDRITLAQMKGAMGGETKQWSEEHDFTF